MRNLISFLLGAATAVVIAAGLALALLHGRISARPAPSTLETGLARALRHWAIPADACDRPNPVEESGTVLAEARAHFADHCASCHGNDGRGDTEMGRGLYPRPPDMRLPATQELSDGELFYIIENGVRLTGMPGWSSPGADRESWKLVHFIRHLPRLTPEELIEMERLNPRSPGEWRELQEEERYLGGQEDEEPTHHAH